MRLDCIRNANSITGAAAFGGIRHWDGQRASDNHHRRQESYRWPVSVVRACGTLGAGFCIDKYDYLQNWYRHSAIEYINGSDLLRPDLIMDRIHKRNYDDTISLNEFDYLHPLKQWAILATIGMY